MASHAAWRSGVHHRIGFRNSCGVTLNKDAARCVAPTSLNVVGIAVPARRKMRHPSDQLTSTPTAPAFHSRTR
jgi:hypothetical protein